MKKAISIILSIILILAITIPASAAKATPKAKVKTTTIKYLNNGANGGHEKDLQAMISDFEKKNPNIKVKPEIIAYKDYFTKVNLLLAARVNNFDCFEVGYEQFYSYAKKGQLQAIDSSIAKDTTFKADSIKKSVLDAYKFDSKQYGMATDYSAVIMYYNKDLFDAKKVEYPTSSWTWKEELAAAQKLTDASAGIWGTVAPLQVYEFYKTIAQNGGSVWSKDNKSVTINSKECVDAVQWMIDKSEKYKVQPPFTSTLYTVSDADLKAFKDGKIAMFRTGSWQLGNFKAECKFNWDVALEPGNTQKAHHFFSNATVAAKSSKNIDAVWQFMKYLSSDSKAATTRIDKGWNLPVVNDATKLANFYKVTPPQNNKAVIESAATLVMPPLGPIPDKWNEIQKVIGDELDKAKYGKVTVQAAMDNAKAGLEALMK